MAQPAPTLQLSPPPNSGAGPEPWHLRAPGPCSSSSLQPRAPGLLSQVSRLPPGRGRGRLAAPGHPRPQAAPHPPSCAHRPCDAHLRGSTPPPPAPFPGGPWRFRTRQARRRAAQHRPENGRRRLGSARPARPRRGALDAAGPGARRPDPRRRAGAPGGPPRREPGLGGAAAGPGGTHDGPARPQTPPNGQRPPPPPSPGKTQLRTCGRTTHLGDSSHYQNKAWISRRVPGFQTQIPGSIQTLHI